MQVTISNTTFKMTRCRGIFYLDEYLNGSYSRYIGSGAREYCKQILISEAKRAIDRKVLLHKLRSKVITDRSKLLKLHEEEGNCQN